RIGSDENVQYFFLALVWYMMAPVFPSLVPFIIFSALHVVHYLSGTFLGVVFPQVSQEVAAVQNHRSGTGRPAGNTGSGSTASLSAPARFALVLNNVSKNYSTRALDAVSLWEVAVVLPALILSAVTLRGSFIAPFVYVHFLRIRYVVSAKTQRAFHFVRVKLDHFFYPPTAHPSMPPFVTNVYGKARDFVVSFGEKAMQQPSPAAGQRTR
ncbi:Transmembrane nucleoporin, partial [Dispira parvispora]